ncbi:alpha/beta fold hydrolase [Amycolatopsis sp. NPDC049868]|uniref:alpha/beta fold hydrolase n=1 Tax=Amycolatopsis sp. NPDC049868 TaxID=3363934 RepID=UPI0037B76DA5
MDTLKMRTAGTEGPAVLLLHGLGATGAVWDGLMRQPGYRWLAPDLPGHGASPHSAHYSFGGLAAAVADALPERGPLLVIGHSLGGVVGLALASGWFGVEVTGLLAVGVKVEWSEDDLARASAMAAKPPRVFPAREDAERGFLKIAGLAGLADADPDGVVETEGGWRLALDPRAFAVGAPDMRGLLGAARCAVVLAAGENDPMSRLEQLRALSPASIELPGLGHNAHVEDPGAVRAALGGLSA